jgi:uncharacterized protein (TIGR02271 family)
MLQRRSDGCDAIGVRGTLEGPVTDVDGDGRARVLLADGRRLWLPPGALERQEHGTLIFRGSFDELAAAARGQTRVAVVPVVEEELRVGKREVEGGGVRVRTRVVERPVEEAVRLREERVNVERRPVNRPVSEADLNAFREGTFELRERSEEAVVDKKARVVEEVAINKEVGERTETVRDTVRSTDVDVQETGGTKARRAAATGRDDNDIDRRKK